MNPSLHFYNSCKVVLAMDCIHAIDTTRNLFKVDFVYLVHKLAARKRHTKSHKKL